MKAAIATILIAASTSIGIELPTDWPPYPSYRVRQYRPVARARYIITQHSGTEAVNIFYSMRSPSYKSQGVWIIQSVRYGKVCLTGGAICVRPLLPGER